MEENKEISDLAKRFLEVISTKGYSNYRLSKEVDIFTDGKLSHIKTGRNQPSDELIDALLQKFTDVRRTWLLTGEGDMLLNLVGHPPETKPRLEAKPIGLADPEGFDATGEKIYVLPDGSKIMEVRVVPIKSQAGYLHGFPDREFYEDLPTLKVSVNNYHAGAYLAFEVQGDSMTPTDMSQIKYAALEGWFVIGRELARHHWKFKLHTESNSKWVIVHKTDGILIKQIIAHDILNGMITIHSLNPKYEDKVLNLDDCEQIFNVVKTEINER